MAQVNNRRISDYLYNEVKEYAKYVVETRACPSIMDGLRVGGRKCIWAALNGDLKRKPKTKMNSLIGDALKLHYNHGDSALMNTIVALSSEHIIKFHPFDVVGQIGTLRENKCDTAPRYLTIKKSKFIDLFTPDIEMLDIMIEEGDKVEPKYFLPIVPIVLLYRTNSPGYGFSFRSFSYTLDSIIDNCIMSLSDGSCQDESFPLKPDVVDIKPKNILYNGNKMSWYSIGEYTLNFEKDTLTITDLPHDQQFLKYEEKLNNLVEKGVIEKYTNLSLDDRIKYIIQFRFGRLKTAYQDKWKFFQTFKLFSKIPKDTLNCINLDGNSIMHFDTPYQLIDEFIKIRLRFYTDRKIKMISLLREKIRVLSEKIKFIELVTSGQIIINKRPLPDIYQDLVKHNLPKDVLKLNIEHLTKEEIEKFNNEIKSLKDYLVYVQETPEKVMYINELVELKEKMCNVEQINIM